MAREDIHSPKNLATEDYAYVGSYDNEAHGFTDEAGNFHEGQRLTVTRRVMSVEGRTWAATHGHDGDQCDHCGAHLRYVALLLHTPTNQVLHVGETCLDNRFSRATADFHTMRKQAELDRAQQRIRKAREAYTAENQDVVDHLTKNRDRAKAGGFNNRFYADLLSKLWQYGSLSEKQTDAVRRNIAKDNERDETKAAEAAAHVVVEVPEGTQVVTGEILNTKTVYTDYGSAYKMLVKDDRGFKVWGTVPESRDCVAGQRITFTASLERSKDDPEFGFFKRPRKAGVLIDGTWQ